MSSRTGQALEGSPYRERNLVNAILNSTSVVFQVKAKSLLGVELSAADASRQANEISNVCIAKFLETTEYGTSAFPKKC